jgi:hypothetical protein
MSPQNVRIKKIKEIYEEPLEVDVKHFFYNDLQVLNPSKSIINV